MLAGAIVPAQSPQLVVSTDKGAVRGLVNGDVASFLGIPYAAPPVGDLRWQPPEPAGQWIGVLDAATVKPRCPQQNRPTASEDCLYLNVYLPADATSEANPVMFWIHGGGLREGGTDSFDPTWLVQRGVIVVTIAYRLGLLGFLVHPALDAASPMHTSGNYGLLDALSALHWVQRNVVAFGGNPDNVTIFGESSGGLLVRALMVSPLAGGLFDRAIVQSGSRQETYPIASARSLSASLVARMGCPDQTLACLQVQSSQPKARSS